MSMKFLVKTKVGDRHLLNGRVYEVVKVRKAKSGWAVKVKKR